MRFAISIPQYARDSRFDGDAFRAHLRRVEELGVFEGVWAQEQVIEQQGALTPPVIGPIAPARLFQGPTCDLPGYITCGAPGGEVPARPNLGSPAWTSRLLTSGYHPPSQCPPCQGCGNLCLPEIPGYFENGQYLTIPSNRMAYGLVMIFSWDQRWPLFGFFNAWANEIPLRSATTGYDVSGPIYEIDDLVQTHMNEAPDVNNPKGDQFVHMIMDWYARVTLCNGPSLSGNCFQYGYGCTLSGGICHGDSAAERNNPTAYTDVNIPATIFGTYVKSMRAEYGF